MGPPLEAQDRGGSKGDVCLREPESLETPCDESSLEGPASAAVVCDQPVEPSSTGSGSSLPGLVLPSSGLVRTSFLPDRRREPDSTWHVLHTLSRQEKAVASAMTGIGITCFLPLRRHVKRRGGSKLVTHLPLFPGYVFLWGTLDEAYQADRTRRIANLIRVPDPASLEWELQNLDRALVTQAPLDPYDALKVGLRARVVAGPCAGVEGLIASRARIGRLVLQVQMLGTAVSLEVDPALVELIGE